MRLEFRLDEAAFSQLMKEMDKELNYELQALNRNEHPETLLNRNKVRIFFLPVVIPDDFMKVINEME